MNAPIDSRTNAAFDVLTLGQVFAVNQNSRSTQSHWWLLAAVMATFGLVVRGVIVWSEPHKVSNVSRKIVDVPSGQTEERQRSSPFRFRDVAHESGLDFRHDSPLTPERHLHLFMGSGLAWIDYDDDGWVDLFVCQGAEWNEKVDPNRLSSSSRLYRNLGNGSFRDVTTDARLIEQGYSMGATVGDIDNDGWPDLYVSRFGPNQLYKNQGDGTFERISPETADSKYGSSCTFADIDNDGDLDLYVVNYLDLSTRYPLCKREEDGRVVHVGCHPRFMKAEPDILYRNNGDGSFLDISESAGLRDQAARQGLGVVAADFDEDGDIDFYVANDSVANQLWINDGNGHFQEDALKYGVALSRGGLAEAGMGVGTADVDGDERLDLFVTNFFNETNTLYRNDGSTFTDVTAEFGLAAPSRSRLGFGTTFIDVDNDGWEDLFVANGHIHTDFPDQPFAQLAQIFWNRGGVRFAVVSSATGDYFSSPVVGRSTAMADFDQDGRPDVAVQHLNGPLALLHNETAKVGNSLQLELIGTTSNRSAIGALVRVDVDSRCLLRTRVGGCSYLACNDGVITVGLGDQSVANRVDVYWPGGRHESWDRLSAGVLHQLREGSSQVKR